MPDSVLLDPPPPRLADSGGGAAGRGRSGWDGDGDGNGGGDSRDARLPFDNSHLLTFLALIASTMLFSGFFGAFVFLSGASKEFRPDGTPPLPSTLWINTLLVVASSVVLAVAHVAQRRGRAAAFRAWLVAAMLLAGAFLATQTWICQRLVASGFALARPTTTNYMGRFYMLVGAHFLHALVGFVLLLIVTVRTFAGATMARLKVSFDVAAIVWHFVDVAWIAIWLLLLD